jgi:hypothetical protein
VELHSPTTVSGSSIRGVERVTRRRCLVAAVLAALAGAAPGLLAQATPRTITGVVRDTSGRPLENAVIALDPNGGVRATRADSSGRFRFDKVSSGRHDLRTTWLGYRPDERTVEVTEDGVDIVIVLQVLPYALDTLAITANRTGIIGTAIVHRDFRPLGGADIQVLGTRWKMRTPASGKFDFPSLRAGNYVVSAKRDGFLTRIVPVVVPSRDAVEVAMVMDTIASKRDRISERDWDTMRARANWRSNTTSAIVGRQELAAHRMETLDLALRYAPSYLIHGFLQDGGECVYVDGRPIPGASVSDFSATGVMLVEVYGPRGTMGPPTVPWPKGLPCGMAHGAPRQRGGNPVVTVYIWMNR